jgi:DNA-directed RNA polymerase specialized sigma subunit
MEVLLQWVADDINTATGIAAEMGISTGQVSKLAKKAIEAGRLKKNGRVYVLV